MSIFCTKTTLIDSQYVKIMRALGFLGVLLSLTLFLSCHGQSCKDLPVYFTTYDEANAKVRSADFPVKETANTSGSSWIRGAEFYSCDGSLGYFILVTDKKSYIYNGVPINIWKNFRAAQSKGGYYNSHIKGRYKLHLKQ